MSDFTERRLHQELSKLSDAELIEALMQGREQANECKPYTKEYDLILDTILMIGEELEKRRIK